jgi:hypothetical protein
MTLRAFIVIHENEIDDAIVVKSKNIDTVLIKLAELWDIDIDMIKNSCQIYETEIYE